MAKYEFLFRKGDIVKVFSTDSDDEHIHRVLKTEGAKFLEYDQRNPKTSGLEASSSGIGFGDGYNTNSRGNSKSQ